MPNTLKPFPIMAPFKGVITDLPSGTDAQALDTCRNVLSRKGRLVSRPALTLFAGLPPDNRTVRGAYSFLDANEQWHTLVLTEATPYFLTNTGGIVTYNPLTLPSGLASLLPVGGGGTAPYAIIEMNQKVFFSNGSVNLLYVDGSSSCYLAGDAPGACKFLSENSSHLIGVSWLNPTSGIQGSQAYPFLVAIASAGDPLTWTPDISNSASQINLIEKGGVPQGVQTLGTYTYVWRAYGANVLWPTGNASAPFYNEPFSWSNPGWGNFYPYTLCTWNQAGLMVTHNGEVLLFNGAAGPSANAFQPLAVGKVKGALNADLQKAQSDFVYAFITDQLGPGYDFEAYVIWIPDANKAWVLNLNEMSWSTWTSNNSYATAFGNLVVL